MNTTTVHPVDEKLPVGRLTALGLQHVLVMYAGAIAVPLIVGRALKLTPEQVALLISADLFACGIIMLILGMLPKMAAFVESIPTFVLGGAGLVMFGMVAATGIRILSSVDYKGNRNNLYIVALSIGFGLIPLVAPRWTQQMAHGLHPLLESGILLTAVAALLLNLFFNGAKGDTADAVEAAKAADAH